MPRLAKKTLRKMPESSRKLGRLLNELDSISHRLRNLIPETETLERTSIAFLKASEIMTEKGKPKARPPTAPTAPLFTKTPNQEITGHADHADRPA